MHRWAGWGQESQHPASCPPGRSFILLILHAFLFTFLGKLRPKNSLATTREETSRTGLRCSWTSCVNSHTLQPPGVQQSPKVGVKEQNLAQSREEHSPN